MKDLAQSIREDWIPAIMAGPDHEFWKRTPEEIARTKRWAEEDLPEWHRKELIEKYGTYY